MYNTIDLTITEFTRQTHTHTHTHTKLIIHNSFFPINILTESSDGFPFIVCVCVCVCVCVPVECVCACEKLTLMYF